MLYNVVLGSENNMWTNSNLRSTELCEPTLAPRARQGFFPLTVASFQPEVNG